MAVAGASHDAGVEVECGGCGLTVLQKAMIPMLGDGGVGLRYRCPTCARALIVPPTVPDGTGDGAGEPGGDGAGDDLGGGVVGSG